MVALVASIMVTVVMTAVIFPYMKRRPVGTFLTWGEAMFAAVYVFFLFFWSYGVVPHLWLRLADNEWSWRSDIIVVGPGNVLEYLPMTITKEVLRDLVAVALYGVLLVGNVVMWMLWQNRGQKVTTEVETSSFGRPLVKGA